MSLFDNQIVKMVANKIAFIAAAWLVHRGLVATDQQSAFENDLVGILIGAISIGVSWWQSRNHQQAKEVIAVVAEAHPAAVAAAQAAVNAKTPNGL
jgi:hypothetical protein